MILVQSRKLARTNATARELWAVYYHVRMVNGFTYIETRDAFGLVQVDPLLCFLHPDEDSSI